MLSPAKSSQPGAPGSLPWLPSHGVLAPGRRAGHSPGQLSKQAGLAR